MEPQDDAATLTDDDIETRPVGTGAADAGALEARDTSDTGDDTGDTSDTSDTGDDSGDTSDTSDTGDDGGDAAPA
jgi:hypothetical protein